MSHCPLYTVISYCLYITSYIYFGIFILHHLDTHNCILYQIIKLINAVGSLLCIGALLGSLSAVFLMDAVGRKVS